MLCTAAYATYSFQRNSARVLPIRVVRALARAFQTALYIPALEILTQEVAVVGPSPASMLWAGSIKASGWHWLMYASVASVVLLLFVPFMLVIALVYNDTNPSSRNIESCAHGRVAFAYTIVRTGIVFCNRFLDMRVTIALLLVSLALIFLGLVLTLPFYHALMNRYYGGLFLTSAWFALGSLVLSAIGDPNGSASFGASVAFLVGAAGVFAGGWLAAARRYAALEAKGRRIIEEGLDTAAIGSLMAAFYPPAPQPIVLPGELTASFRNRAQSVSSRRYTAQHGAVGGPRESLTLAARPGPSGSRASLSNAGGSFRIFPEGLVLPPTPSTSTLQLLRRVAAAFRERARLFWVSFEVEVATRFARGDQSEVTLDAVEAIYRAGYAVFPESAYVRLAFSTYIAFQRSNPMRALQVQREAWALNPAFDIRFALVAMKRDFEQKTASSNLGEAKGMNFISVLEFRRLHEAATLWHNESIGQLRALWKSLARTRLSESALAAVPRKLEGISRAMRTATESYRSLLMKYPHSKLLLREYGAFLHGPGNDPDLAQIHFAAADEMDEANEDGGAGNGSNSLGSSKLRKLQKKYMKGTGSASGSASSSDVAARARSEAQRTDAAQQDIKHVRRVRWGIIGGLTLITGLTAVFFIVIMQVFSLVSQSIFRIAAASSQMRRLLEFCFLSRSVQMYALMGDAAEFENARTELADATELYGTDARGLYLGFEAAGVPASSSPDVADLWTAPSVRVLRYVPGPPAARVEDRMSLWAVSYFLLGVVKEIATAPMERMAAPVDAFESFRFVADNAATTVLATAGSAAGLYEREIYAATWSSKVSIGAILAAILASLLALALLVFQPAFRKVRQSMRGVSEIVVSMPPAVRKGMYQRFAGMRRVDDAGSDNEEEEAASDPDEEDGPPPDEPEAGAGADAGAGEGGPRLRAIAIAELDQEHGAALHARPAAWSPAGGSSLRSPGAPPPLAKQTSFALPHGSPRGTVPGSPMQPRLPPAFTPREEGEGGSTVRALEAGGVLVYQIEGGASTDRSSAAAPAPARAAPAASSKGTSKSASPPVSSAALWASLEPLEAGPAPAEPHGALLPPAPRGRGGPGGLESLAPAALEADAEREAARRAHAGGEPRAVPPASPPVPAGNSRLRRRSVPRALRSFDESPRAAAEMDREREGRAPGNANPLAGLFADAGDEVVEFALPPAAAAAEQPPEAPPNRRASAAGSVLSAGSDMSDGKKQGGADQFGGAANGTGDIISILTKRYILGFAAIALIAIANFVVCFVFMDRTQYVAAYIREAGRRWALVTELHHYARESFVNDGFYRPLDELLMKLHAVAAELSAVEMSLVHGNASAGLAPALARYPPQDRLLFEEKCLHLDPARCVDGEVSNMAAVTSGIEFMVQIVVRSAYTILQDHRYFDAAGLPDAGRLAELRRAGTSPNFDVAAIKARSAGMRQILEVDESDNLDDGLTRSMRAYQQMADEKIHTVVTIESYILAFNILFIFSLYVFVFRSVIRRLQTECTRTTQFVSMLPPAVIAEVPALHKYKRSSD